MQAEGFHRLPELRAWGSSDKDSKGLLVRPQRQLQVLHWLTDA